MSAGRTAAARPEKKPATARAPVNAPSAPIRAAPASALSMPICAAAGFFSGRAAAVRPALIDGAPGAIWSYLGETRVVFAFTITGGTITVIDLIADPEHIARLDVVPLSAGAEARRAQRGQLAGSSGIALARTTLA